MVKNKALLLNDLHDRSLAENDLNVWVKNAKSSKLAYTSI